MTNYRVEGGTHVGIVGCYGEKLFRARGIKDLLAQVTKNRKLEKFTLKGGRVDGLSMIGGIDPKPLRPDKNWWSWFDGDTVVFELHIKSARKETT